MLKPAGTLSFAVGSLSSAAGMGGGATGASLAAASLPAGRPINGEPGGSAGAAAGAAAGGAAGCCAAAPSVNAPITAPASNRLRDDEQIIMMSSPVRKPLSWRGKHYAGAGGFPGRQSPIFSRRSAIGNIGGEARGAAGIGRGRRCRARSQTGTSFRDGPTDQTRNLEIPDSLV